mmetsp:Transcript_9751/g.19145  ORF Transcript_9751/g.19145 Transcript_9751/m.19145 type:complete len:91 (-) Transcript_9751:91-363(-)
MRTVFLMPKVITEMLDHAISHITTKMTKKRMEVVRRALQKHTYRFLRRAKCSNACTCREIGLRQQQEDQHAIWIISAPLHLVTYHPPLRD